MAAPTVSVAASLAASQPGKAYTAPLATYLSSTNASFFSITWLAMEAANLAGVSCAGVKLVITDAQNG